MKLAPVNIKNKRATFDYELLDLPLCPFVCLSTKKDWLKLLWLWLKVKSNMTNVSL